MAQTTTLIIKLQGQAAIKIECTVTEEFECAVRKLQTSIKEEITVEGQFPRLATNLACALIAKGVVSK